jgi:aldehyde dehydrogenase (NAD+)
LNTKITSINGQKEFFKSGATQSLSFRKKQLRLLLKLVIEYEEKLHEALFLDLGKSPFEAYATETGLIREEIKTHIKNLSRWMQPQRVSTPLTAFPAQSFIETMPFGVSLIISPWNYPVQLALSPLIGAISSGNCVVLKPSEYSSHTSAVLDEMINTNFDPDYIRLIQGDANTSKQLLAEPFDFIFFTGSTQVGKEIMKAAAKHLIPVVLELGGKSPCIVDETANPALAARRIIWGKTINAGQTCIAPDYLLVHEKIRDRLLEALQNEITRQWGTSAITNEEYPKIIGNPQFERLLQLLEGQKILSGGNSSAESLKIEPTIIEPALLKETVMQEEIFGPILPMISYSNYSQAIDIINQNPKPLAMYIFSEDKKFIKKFKSNVLSGGITINDTIMHFTNGKLPFGGSGSSGIGSYHGKFSYDAFSHHRGVMKRGNWPDIWLRYAPFKSKLKLIKNIIK